MRNEVNKDERTEGMLDQIVLKAISFILEVYTRYSTKLGSKNTPMYENKQSPAISRIVVRSWIQ